MTYPGNNANPSSETITYNYNSVGQITSMTDGNNNLVESYSISSLFRHCRFFGGFWREARAYPLLMRSKAVGAKVRAGITVGALQIPYRTSVMPAKAGIQVSQNRRAHICLPWVPAFAGTTQRVRPRAGKCLRTHGARPPVFCPYYKSGL